MDVYVERDLPGGKSPAFCAAQGELHATNAGTGTCRLDRSAARCRSVAGEGPKSFARSITLCCPCSAQALGNRPWLPVKRMRLTQGRIYGGPENKLRSTPAVANRLNRLSLSPSGPLFLVGCESM
jgi:hypothetical protein